MSTVFEGRPRALRACGRPGIELTECLNSPSPIVSTRQMSVRVPRMSSFLLSNAYEFTSLHERRGGTGWPRTDAHRTSTMDCRTARMRVNCLFGARIEAVGPYGMNAASENADELNVMWKGIGSVTLNTRDDGMYS